MVTGSCGGGRACQVSGSHTVPRLFLTYFSGDRDQVFVVIPDTAKKGPNHEITIDEKC